MKEIVYQDIALKALRKYRNQSDFIISKIEIYAKTSGGNVKTLVNKDEQKRLRVGDYRVLFIEGDKTIEIQDIGHRSDIYTKG
jgi:mRNA-degrading endonuclease RelE of RelBE toxin-antitoxin system